MATVRRATESDLDTLIEMGRALHDESPRYCGMEFSPDKLRRLWVHLKGTLLAENGCVFVAESKGEVVGMTIGTVADRWFSDEQFVTDLTMYVKPEHRGGSAFYRLATALEDWGAEQGIRDFAFGVSTEIHADKTVRAYEKMGYRVAGHTMVKRNGH